MLATLAVVGLCLAAMKQATGIWASITVSVTLLILLASLVAAVDTSSSGPVRGFAVVGWGYFLVAFSSPFSDLKPHLITSSWIADTFGLLHHSTATSSHVAPLPAPGEKTKEVFTGRGVVLVQPRDAPYENVAGLGPVRTTNEVEGLPPQIVWFTPDFGAYARASHCLFCLLLAVLGLLIGSLLRPHRQAGEGGRGR
jgi:hypothetical protein